jgi:hypothetical protein
MHFVAFTVVAAVSTSIPYSAHAGPSCSGGTSCSDCCLAYIDSTSGDTGIYAQSYNGLGINSQDTGGGVGVNGYSTSGIGVLGMANESGVSVPAGEFGVYGESPSYGVYGSSANIGVAGSGTTYGVSGGSVNGYGVYGSSTYSDGVHGDVSNGNSAVAGINHNTGAGVWAENTYTGYGLYASGVSGDAIYATASSANGVYGTSSDGGASGGYFQNTGSGGNDVGVAGYSVNNYGGWFSTSNGTYAAYFNKDININGTGYGPSDRRYKKNIAPVSDAIDQLLKLQGVSFEWIEPEKHNDATGTQIGFIAQDVEKVFPRWVKTDADGFKTLSVAQIEGLEVEAIRTLKMQNDVLVSQVRELQSGRRAIVSGIDLNGVGFGIGGVAIAVAVVVTARRRREESTRTIS